MNTWFGKGWVKLARPGDLFQTLRVNPVWIRDWILESIPAPKSFAGEEAALAMQWSTQSSVPAQSGWHRSWAGTGAELSRVQPSLHGTQLLGSWVPCAPGKGIFRNQIWGEKGNNLTSFSKAQPLLQFQPTASLYDVLQKEPSACMLTRNTQFPFSWKLARYLQESLCEVYTSYSVHQLRNTQEKALFLSGCQRICFNLDHECTALTLTRCLKSSFFHTVCKWCSWTLWTFPSAEPRGTACVLTCPSEENPLQCPKPMALQVQFLTTRRCLV